MGIDAQEELTIYKNGKVKPPPIKFIFNLLKPVYDIKILNFIINFISENKIGFEPDEVTVIATSQTVNFNYNNKDKQQLIINLSKVNDFKKINDMFMAIKTCLIPGGYYFGVFSPLEEDYKMIRNKMPKFLFMVLYPLHFIFFRIFPKIPLISHFYEFLTKGQGRFLSRAEVFGRLAYCGYNICDSFILDFKIYFVAQSVMTKSNQKYPSLGPIIRLDRLGYKNEVIKIYKFRTMHPYSEFIQRNIFEKYNLDNSGKFNNDFRITPWGKFLRKLWIDELPQLYNWLKGDITLVGVRALSKHYFSLYPIKLQKLRVNMKPGLVPPYYADLPQTFDEIINSECQYLEKKLKNRFTTDLIYFFKALNNILIKGARSQ